MLIFLREVMSYILSILEAINAIKAIKAIKAVKAVKAIKAAKAIKANLWGNPLTLKKCCDRDIFFVKMSGFSFTFLYGSAFIA